METVLYRINIGMGYNAHITLESVKTVTATSLCGRTGRSSGREINLKSPGICKVCKKALAAMERAEEAS